jgi:hypothetical protein
MANMASRGVVTQEGRGYQTATHQHTGQNWNVHNVPIVGAGLLGLISSFLPWFGYRYTGWTNYTRYLPGGGYGYGLGQGLGGYGQLRTWHSGLNAWHSGSLAWLPILLMLAAAAAAAAHMMSGSRGGLGSIGTSTAIASLGALSLLLIVVRWITLPHVNGFYNGYHATSSGARAGLILGLISSLLMTLFALRRLKASGEEGGRRYEREASLAGYAGRGADRARVTDRERVETTGRTATTDQPRRGYTTPTTTTERTYPADRSGGGGTERDDNAGGRGEWDAGGRGDWGAGDRTTRDRWDDNNR